MKSLSEKSLTKTQDYFVIVAPGERWQTIYLITDAPSASEACEAVWTARGYNSGEPIRVRTAENRELAAGSVAEVIAYDAKRVNEMREMVRYND